MVRFIKDGCCFHCVLLFAGLSLGWCDLRSAMKKDEQLLGQVITTVGSVGVEGEEMHFSLQQRSDCAITCSMLS